VRILIVNNAEEGISEFNKPIENILSEAGISFKTIQYFDLPKENISNYEGVILGASPKGNNIVDTHQEYYQCIKDSEIPVFGICAGHQIIGKLFGAELIRGKRPEFGLCYVEIEKDDPIFKGYANGFLVYQAHKDRISLPKDFVLLGSSDECGVQIMKHESKAIYTVQFHTELSNKELVLNFLEIAKKFKARQIRKDYK
jgi:GMP synthase-like glutamine amidotransferase